VHGLWADPDVLATFHFGLAVHREAVERNMARIKPLLQSRAGILREELRQNTVDAFTYRLRGHCGL
jgi:hypothetical protein